MNAVRERVLATKDISRRQLVAVRDAIARPHSALTLPHESELAVALEDIPAGRWGFVERWIDPATSRGMSD